MLCDEGNKLFKKHLHHMEERTRNAEGCASGAVKREGGYHTGSSTLQTSAEFLTWATHRAFCVQCRSMASSRDMIQMVSV